MLAIKIISGGELCELNPDNQNSCVSSCSQTDVEQFSAETSRRGVELSRQEWPTGAVEDGSRTLVEVSHCDVGKNAAANISSSPDRCVGGDGVSSIQCTQNFEGLGQNGDCSREVGAIALTNCGKNVVHVQMDVENPPGDVLTASTECGETLFEGRKDQVQMDVENSSEEVLTTEYSKTLFEGYEDQVQMDVEDNFGEIQNVSTENLFNSFAVPIQIGVEDTTGKLQTTDSECSETLYKQVQMDIEKIAGEVLTNVTRSENVSENRIQTDVKSSLSEKQTTSPECVEKPLKSCESEVQMNVEITSEKVQTISTDCAYLSEGHENQVLVNAKSCVSEKLRCSEISLGGCEDHIQINVESRSFLESSKNSMELGLEQVDSGVENTSDDANILADFKKKSSKHDGDISMNLSVTDDLALLALDDSSSVKVKHIIESIDPKDLPSCDHIPEVQFSDTSAGTPNTSLESSGNVSSDMEMDLSLVSYNMLSEVLEEEDINGIFLSTLSSQESDSHSDTSDSDRLIIDCDEPPKKEISNSGILADEKETSPVEQLRENDQTSVSGDRVERLKVTSEGLNPEDLSANLVCIDESSTTPGGCDNAVGGLPVVTKKVDEPQVLEEKSSVSPENKVGELLNSELESEAKTEGGSGANKADELEENGRDGVNVDSEVKEESGGMSNKMVVRNGVLFVPSRMVVKREVPFKSEVKSNPTPSFDVGNVWQVVKKRAMGMNAKPDK